MRTAVLRGSWWPGIAMVGAGVTLAPPGSGWWGGPVARARSWFGGETPLGVTAIAGPVSKLLALAALVTLAGSWLVVGLQVRARAVTTRRLLLLAVAVGVPLAVGPPLGSGDAMTYV